MKKIFTYLSKTFIFVSMLCAHAQAQSYVEKMLTHKVSAHYPDHIVNTHVEPYNKVVILNDREYYWFSGNQINITQGGYSGKLLNGDYEDLYLNKNIKASGSFDRGLKTGTWKSWNEKGILKDLFTFDKGRKNGPYCKYDSAGKVIEKGMYLNDLLNGRQEIVSKDSTMVTNYKDGKVKPHKDILPKFIYKVFPKKTVKPTQP